LNMQRVRRRALRTGFVSISDPLFGNPKLTAEPAKNRPVPGALSDATNLVLRAAKEQRG
jgi:hypothetical protein